MCGCHCVCTHAQAGFKLQGPLAWGIPVCFCPGAASIPRPGSHPCLGRRFLASDARPPKATPAVYVCLWFSEARRLTRGDGEVILKMTQKRERCRMAFWMAAVPLAAGAPTCRGPGHSQDVDAGCLRGCPPGPFLFCRAHPVSGFAGCSNKSVAGSVPTLSLLGDKRSGRMAGGPGALGHIYLQK